MKDLQDAFKQLMKPKGNIFPAKVVSVDEEKGTCTVSDEELEFTDVQLSATVEDDRRCLLLPKIDSFVMVMPVNADIHHLIVVTVSEVSKVIFRTDNAEFSFNDEGFLLKKQNESLKELMVDLLQAIQNMKFTTNTGSTIALINVLDFKAIETRFQSFLKNN